MPIHPTAIIDASAEIDPTADIGPYVVIDGSVSIKANVRIYAHAYLSGWTDIAEDCEVHPFAVVGHLPQDFHFKGDKSYCRIGPRTIIREHVTVHRSAHADGETVIGSDCQLLCGTHVGHDAVLGKGVTLIPFAAVAGHAEIHDRVIISNASAVHQFTRVGRLAMLGGGSIITQDVPPFMMTIDRGAPIGVNVIGMKRASLPKEDISEIRQLYREVYRSDRPISVSVDAFRERVATPSGRAFVEFMDNPGRRGIIRAGRQPRD